MMVTKAMIEACELLCEASEHEEMAIMWKEEDPNLSNAFHESSTSLIATADRIYQAVREHVERVPQGVDKDVWNYHKMRYLNKVEKAKTKHASYQKM